ncbi:MAG: hypothetical protein M1816_004264 [Peltula sp. TS41687]|nr:MAG: hypothetical protein M1816_004264 [Peltula sp. TS41687]
MYLSKWIQRPLYEKDQDKPLANLQTSPKKLDRYSKALQDACGRWKNLRGTFGDDWTHNSQEVRQSIEMLVQSVAAWLQLMINAAMAIDQHARGAHVNPALVERLRDFQVTVNLMSDE